MLHPYVLLVEHSVLGYMKDHARLPQCMPMYVQTRLAVEQLEIRIKMSIFVSLLLSEFSTKLVLREL